MNKKIIIYRVKLDFGADNNPFYYEEEAIVETIKLKYSNSDPVILRDRTIINGDYLYLFFELKQKSSVKVYSV